MKRNHTDRLATHGLWSSALMPFSDSEHLTPPNTDCGKRMIVLQDALYLISKPLCESSHGGFHAGDRL